MGISKLKRDSLLAVFLSAIIFASTGAVLAQRGETFKARLTPVPIDTTMMSRIAGFGSAAAVLTGRRLAITGNFSGLRSPAADAHIHVAPKGLRGPAVLDVAVSKGTSGTITASIELTPEQVDDLRNARLYLQIDSEGAPEGNLWGWLLP
jgi:hypothetical protein